MINDAAKVPIDIHEALATGSVPTVKRIKSKRKLPNAPAMMATGEILAAYRSILAVTKKLIATSPIA
jgi:hypothetical protein